MPSSVRVALSVTALVLVACSEPPTPPAAPGAPSFAKVRSTTPQVQLVVDVSQDTTAQNETPLAVNPLNPDNWITGANDWNFNDGCAVNASFDGGRTWTPTLPNGFIPGLTAFTNDPAVAGTGIYEAAGDPAVAFGPDGTAYFACQAFIFSQPPFPIALFVSRSSDGGRTWLDGVRGHQGADPQQPGRTDRDRAGRHPVPDVRQRHPGREGHGQLRHGVEGRRPDVEPAVRVLPVQQPCLPVSAVLLQHLRWPVPRAGVVSRAGLRSAAQPARRRLRRHRRERPGEGVLHVGPRG